MAWNKGKKVVGPALTLQFMPKREDLYVDAEYADLLDGAKLEKIGDFGVIVRSKDASSSVDNTLNSVMTTLELSLKPSIVNAISTNNPLQPILLKRGFLLSLMIQLSLNKT